MKSKKPITALFLMLPAVAWAETMMVPEPEILPLLAIGGVVAVAVKFMRRK